MRNLFFYGTLRSQDLLATVLGRPVAEIDLSPAQLDGWQACTVLDGDYPLIREVAGAQAEGLLAKGLSETDIDRLNYYEGAFGWFLVPVTAQTEAGPVAADVFLPENTARAAREGWDFHGWKDAFEEIQHDPPIR